MKMVLVVVLLSFSAIGFAQEKNDPPQVTLPEYNRVLQENEKLRQENKKLQTGQRTPAEARAKVTTDYTQLYREQRDLGRKSCLDAGGKEFHVSTQGTQLTWTCVWR